MGGLAINLINSGRYPHILNTFERFECESNCIIN